jgi:hypothetical protein
MLQGWFTEHPHAAGESYFEHQRTALRFARRLFWAAGVCFVHALVPALFERTASGCVAEIHEQMMRRKLQAPGARAQHSLRRYPAFF